MFIILILKIQGSRHGFTLNAQLNVLGGTADTQHNYHGPIDIQIDRCCHIGHRIFHPRKFQPRKFQPRKFHPRIFHPRTISPHCLFHHPVYFIHGNFTHGNFTHGNFTHGNFTTLSNFTALFISRLQKMKFKNTLPF